MVSMQSTTVLIYTALVGIIALSGCGRPIADDPPPDATAAQSIRLTLVSNSTGGSVSGATETQAAAKSTGWGTIKGRFVYDGTPPSPQPLNINKDPEVCGKHNLTNESILVGPNGGLANVVLFVRGPKNIDIHPDFAASAEQKAVLDNRDCHFVPHILALRTGQTLEIKNSDPVGHNTNAALVSNSPFNVIISSGTQADQKLSAAEPLPVTVTCNIHPWMRGYLVVQPHPYVAISEKDGTFEIKNAPAGIPLEFQVWHEASTGNNGAVAVNRPDLKWQPTGRFTVTLQPDQVLDLSDIKIPSSALAAK
jgi:plastocyanin